MPDLFIDQQKDPLGCTHDLPEARTICKAMDTPQTQSTTPSPSDFRPAFVTCKLPDGGLFGEVLDVAIMDGLYFLAHEDIPDKVIEIVPNDGLMVSFLSSPTEAA